MYAQFVDGKSTIVKMTLAEDENPAEWTKVDESLAGCRLIKDGKKVRAMTEEEISAEREAARAAYEASLNKEA